MSAPVALSVEPCGEVLGRRLYRVTVANGSDLYKVMMSVRPGCVALYGTKTKSGRSASGNRRTDIERCAIDAVQL